MKLEYPHIPGADGAGEIATLSESVDDWSSGERVVINPNLSCGTCAYCLAGMDNRCNDWGLLGETTRGTYAEYIAVPSRNLLRIPDSLSAHQAAAASLVFLTAWHSLIKRGRMKAGETVLIVGASGGVNLASLQIAKLGGARVIVVGSGLAGASASATLAELGYNVSCFTYHDSPRRAHSIAAQGGINAAKNYQGDGDSIFRLFYDTIKGGDFRAREANVWRLAELSTQIIDQAVAQVARIVVVRVGELDVVETGGGASSSTVISPKMHDEFCLPYDRDMHRAVHDAGLTNPAPSAR